MEGVLRLDDVEVTHRDTLPQAPAVGAEQAQVEPGVEGGAGLVVGQVQGGAAVGGVHDRDEGLGDHARLVRGAGAGLHEALDDEQATVGCDAVGVVGIVLETVLDRGLA